MKRPVKSANTHANENTKKAKPNVSILVDHALKNLSSNIEYLLSINKMDKSELASSLGITHQTLSKYLGSKTESPIPMPLKS